MALFTDEIRKSAGNAGIKTFTSKLDQGLMADAVTRGELTLSSILHSSSSDNVMLKYAYSDLQIYVVYCQENSLDIVCCSCIAEHIPKPSNTGIPVGMGVDFLPVSKQDSKEGMICIGTCIKVCKTLLH